MNSLRSMALWNWSTNVVEKGMLALVEISSRKMNGEDASQALEFAWLSSVLDRISVLQPQLSGFDADNHYRAVKEFTAADEEHIVTSAERIRRSWAGNVVKVLDENPLAAQIVARQATLKQKHLPMRDLFDSTSVVLTALKPCWVMSPLVVAQALPPRQCFDTVIFDEASQILPADAIPTLLRGKQAIVAGDPYQLPPTTFFIAGVDDPLDDSVDNPLEDEAVLSSEAQEALDAGRAIALTRDHDSVLDVMRTLLPPPHGTKTLGWHYRSQDERLITFSNSRPSLYDWSLTTFPGARGEESIRHVLIPFQPGSGGPTASVSQEVDKVVELIIEHARKRPKESLGVVALGVRHADRISERLRAELSNYQEYEEFFGEEKAEPFFIKNLERVQGDERDSIILTVGYGKTSDGRMRYNFGPVNQEGGDRRLNVAITRARRSITVVSSFSGREMDPDRLHGHGPQMLRDYLLYAESGGDNLGLEVHRPDGASPESLYRWTHHLRRHVVHLLRTGTRRQGGCDLPRLRAPGPQSGRRTRPGAASDHEGKGSP